MARRKRPTPAGGPRRPVMPGHGPGPGSTPGSAGPRKGRRRPGKSSGGGGGGSVWLFGRHPVTAALANPARTILRLIATGEAVEKLAEARPDFSHNLAPEVVDRETFERVLPPGAVHQGIAAEVMPLEGADASDLPGLAEAVEAEGGRAVAVVLDQVTDPHNVGAILRSAAAFGAIAVIVQDRHAPEESGTLAKSASGALEAVPIMRVTNLNRALDDMKQTMGFWTVGLDAHTDKTLAQTDLPERVALVLGAEGKGLRRLTAEACDHLAMLPMTGKVESLNVSNAAAVALYELLGRRG